MADADRPDLADLGAVVATHGLAALTVAGRVAAVGAAWVARLGRDPTGEPAAALVAAGDAAALAALVAASAGASADANAGADAGAVAREVDVDVDVGAARLRVRAIGRGDAALLVAADITELAATARAARRAEAVLREVGSTLTRTRHRLEEAETLAGVGSFELDLVTRTVTLSPSVYELLGAGPDERLDELDALRGFAHPDEVDRLRSWFWSAPREEERREITTRLVRRDGAIRHVRAVLTTDRRPDGGSLISGSIHDVTAAHDAAVALAAARDEAAAARRAHGQFVAAVGHELRTSAASAIGLVELAAAGGAAAAGDLARAAAATRQLLDGIDQLLDVARLDAAPALDAGDLELDEVVAAAAAQVAAAAEARGATVATSIAPGLGRRRRGDAARVRQLIASLVARAIERAGAGAVTLTARPGDAADQVRLDVQIAARGEGAAPATSGGLGLAVARALAARLGGGVDDRDAGFTAIVPLPERSGDAAATAATRSPRAATAATRPLRVLLADDTELVRDVVARLLAEGGHRVDAVGDGEAAARAAAATAYDLILMDLAMPGLDGLAATRRIRRDARAGGRARVPIVALTAWPDDEPAALDAGVDRYLIKPVEGSRLAALCADVAGGAVRAPIDRDALLARVGGNAKIAADLAALFAGQRARLAAGVRDAIARGDVEAIARTAHGVRGALAMVAAGPATDAASALEAAADDPDAWAPRLSELEREIARAAADLALDVQ